MASALNLRTLLVTAIPTAAVLIGFMWFRRKKQLSDNPLEKPESDQDEADSVKVNLPKTKKDEPDSLVTDSGDDTVLNSVSVVAQAQDNLKSQFEEHDRKEINANISKNNLPSGSKYRGSSGEPDQKQVEDDLSSRKEETCVSEEVVPELSVNIFAQNDLSAPIDFSNETEGDVVLETAISDWSKEVLESEVLEQSQDGSNVYAITEEFIIADKLSPLKDSQINHIKSEISVDTPDKSISPDKPLDHTDDVNNSNATANDQQVLIENGVSDSHSEVSSDSGHGNSVPETPVDSTNQPDPDSPAVFKFDFPSDLCGRLIGKYGKNINSLKAKTGADVILSSKPFDDKYQLCSIQGTKKQVDDTLDEIKCRFPAKQYPDITYEQLESHPILSPGNMQLTLPEGVSVDVLVSSVVDVNHVFIQQPTHPTFSSLERLNFVMNQCYGAPGVVVPQLPRPIEAGVICVAPMYGGWYRAQVMEAFPDTDECNVKFVDYGGYMKLQGFVLRQIRSDFTTLPFQAVECYLANVIPPKDEEGFLPESVAVLEQLVQRKLLQAQISSYEADGVPYIQLFEFQQDRTVFVNRELVNAGIARWLEMS